MKYQLGARYETVLDLVRQAKNWSLHARLFDEPSQAAAVLNRVFQVAVEGGDDQAASVYADWILRGIGDSRLQPLLDKNGKLPVGGDQIKQAIDQVCRLQAAAAQELYQFLPDKAQVSDAYEQRANSPTMLETKRVLLTEVVQRWRETKDETEADAWCDFLCGLNVQFYDQEKMIESVLRAGTDRGFPPVRAARHYLRALKKSHKAITSAEIVSGLLILVWLRNSKKDQQAQIVEEVLPLLGASQEAFTFMTAQAAQVRELDSKLRLLCDQLQSRRIFHERKVLVQYVTSAEVTVTVELSASDFFGFFATSNRSQFDSRKAEECFVELMNIVNSWRTEPEFNT